MCSCDKKKDFTAKNISINPVIPGNKKSQRVLVRHKNFLYSTLANILSIVQFELCKWKNIDIFYCLNFEYLCSFDRLHYGYSCLKNVMGSLLQSTICLTFSLISQTHCYHVHYALRRVSITSGKQIILYFFY